MQRFQLPQANGPKQCQPDHLKHLTDIQSRAGKVEVYCSLQAECHTAAGPTSGVMIMTRRLPIDIKDRDIEALRRAPSR